MRPDAHGVARAPSVLVRPVLLVADLPIRHVVGGRVAICRSKRGPVPGARGARRERFANRRGHVGDEVGRLLCCAGYEIDDNVADRTSFVQQLAELVRPDGRQRWPVKGAALLGDHGRLHRVRFIWQAPRLRPDRTEPIEAVGGYAGRVAKSAHAKLADLSDEGRVKIVGQRVERTFGVVRPEQVRAEELGADLSHVLWADDYHHRRCGHRGGERTGRCRHVRCGDKRGYDPGADHSGAQPARLNPRQYPPW